MKIEFNKEIMLNNIYYLLKEKSIKIGDFEEKSGVSVGYLSRLGKDEKSKPSLETVMKMAYYLRVSVDMLVTFDLTGLTATENYLINFFQKLKEKTMRSEINWGKESAISLNQLTDTLSESVNHPMYEYVDIAEGQNSGSTQTVRKAIFKSHNYDIQTRISDDCYNCVFSDNYSLYIMSVQGAGKFDANVLEAWVITPSWDKEFLCSSSGNPFLGATMRELYMAIAESMKHPKLNFYIKDAIDGFMNEIPF